MHILSNGQYSAHCFPAPLGDLTVQTSFAFQINEVREHPDSLPAVDSYGHWLPPHRRGDNYIHNGGASYVWWICNGTQIYEISAGSVPPGIRHYKTFSIYYSAGCGFRVLHGNATDPPAGETWHTLGFQHDPEDGYSSILTNVLQEPTLRCHRADQIWPRMLLPDIYHGPEATDPSQGGLKGELAILLALLAFSMPESYLRTYLPFIFQGGIWQTHNHPHGRESSASHRVFVQNELIAAHRY